MTEYQGHHIEWGHGTGDFWQVVPLAVVDRNTPKGPPLNEWREVCRWDEPSIFDDLGTLEYGPQSEPMSDEELAVAKDEALKMVLGERDFELLRQMAELWPTSMELWEAFQNMAAAFEELAGEHNRYLAHRGSLDPSPGPGWYWVRGHWRSRNQAVGGAIPTGDTEPATNPPNTSSGEATGQGWMIDEVPPEGFGDGVTVWECENCHKPVCRLDHECIPQSGEERSE